MMPARRVPREHRQLQSLRFGPLSKHTIHLCIDMQNLFALNTPWHTPWMARVLPVVTRLAERHPSRTVFTRSSHRSGPIRCLRVVARSLSTPHGSFDP
jgi:hypothetical protein